MTIAEAEAAPALSIPAPDPIGRLYRLPTSEPLRTGPNGGVILPTDEVIAAKIRSGEWMPSITNILSVRNAPHLMGWAARKAAQTAIEMETKYPGSLVARPAAAAKYLSTAHERDRDNAAGQGTAVHYACELLAQGLPVPDGLLNDKQKLYVRQWERWRSDFSPEFIATEMTVFGDTAAGKYAGTTDFVCTINGVNVVGDIKTTRSGIHDDVAFQLSAVAHSDACTLDNQTLSALPRIDAAYALHLSERSYTFAPVVIDGEPWDVFCALRQVWDVHVFHGRLRNGDKLIQPPATQPSQVVPRRSNG